MSAHAILNALLVNNGEAMAREQVAYNNFAPEINESTAPLPAAALGYVSLLHSAARIGGAAPADETRPAPLAVPAARPADVPRERAEHLFDHTTQAVPHAYEGQTMGPVSINRPRPLRQIAEDPQVSERDREIAQQRLKHLINNYRSELIEALEAGHNAHNQARQWGTTKEIAARDRMSDRDDMS
jgi:hypothetical protein